MSSHTLVIGGGIAGLTAAHALVSRGTSVELLEASPRLGGIIRTEHIDGFTIEAGPDSMLAQKPAALQLCEELGLGARLVSTLPPRIAFVLKDGTLHELPRRSVLGIPLDLRAIASYSALPWPARARLALEPFIAARQQPDESVASFFRRRFGRATVEILAEPLLGGIHAGDVEALSMRSLFPRFLDLETRYGSVRRGLAATHTSPRDGVFRSLSGGMEELVSALAARLPEDSAYVNTPVESIVRDVNTWRVTTPSREFSADSVILAVPAHVAARLLRTIDQRAAELCAEVSYVSTVSVALGWPRHLVSHPLRGSGFVVARRAGVPRITACTWVSSKWPGRAPEGSVLLRAYLGGAHDTAAVDLDDKALVDTAVHDLAAVLGITGPPQLSRVYRWPLAGAQHNVGHLARIAELETLLAQHPGLFATGSGFRSVGIPDCIADATATADAVATQRPRP